MRLNTQGYKSYTSTLYFNNNEACFTFRAVNPTGETTPSNSEEKINLNVVDTVAYFIKSSLNTQTITELVRSLESKTPFYKIEENIGSIEWVITDSTKIIGSHSCYKARCRYAGRNFIAWFTPDIAAYFGPWKLRNLPGLILEASDDKKEVEFYAKDITSIVMPIAAIDPKFNYPLITKREYYQKINDFVSDMGQQIGAKLGRGFKVKLSNPKVSTIELYEN